MFWPLWVSHLIKDLQVEGVHARRNCALDHLVPAGVLGSIVSSWRFIYCIAKSDPAVWIHASHSIVLGQLCLCGKTAQKKNLSGYSPKLSLDPDLIAFLWVLTVPDCEWGRSTRPEGLIGENNQVGELAWSLHGLQSCNNIIYQTVLFKTFTDDHIPGLGLVDYQVQLHQYKTMNMIISSATKFQKHFSAMKSRDDNHIFLTLIPLSFLAHRLIEMSSVFTWTTVMLSRPTVPSEPPYWSCLAACASKWTCCCCCVGVIRRKSWGSSPIYTWRHTHTQRFRLIIYANSVVGQS